MQYDVKINYSDFDIPLHNTILLVLVLQFCATDAFSPRHHHHFLSVLPAPLHSPLETGMSLVGAYGKDVEIYLLYVLIYIFVYPYFVNIAYRLKHEDFLFQRIHYLRFGFILQDRVIVLYGNNKFTPPPGRPGRGCPSRIQHIS